jgi:hypothetical protein
MHLYEKDLVVYVLVVVAFDFDQIQMHEQIEFHFLRFVRELVEVVEFEFGVLGIVIEN